MLVNEDFSKDRQKEKKFRFSMPLDYIEKSKDSEGKEIMKLGGLASTTAVDTDGETIQQNFDLSYLKKQGMITWNHQKTPDAVIGEPSKIEMRPQGLYVESQLYSDSNLAKSVWKLAKTLQNNSTKRRLSYSIEGKVLERDEDSPEIVKKAMITNVTLTMNSKNPLALVDIIKGHFDEPEEIAKISDKSAQEEVDILLKAFSSPEEREALILDITRKDGMRVTVDNEYNTKIEKALTAGSETGRDLANVSTSGSGAPLKTESVDGHTKDLLKTKKKKKNQDTEEDEDDKNYLSKSEVFEKIFNEFPGIGFQKAEKIFNTLNQLQMKKNLKKSNVSDDLLEKALSSLKSGLLNKGEDDDIDENDEVDDAEDKGDDDIDSTEETDDVTASTDENEEDNDDTTEENDEAEEDNDELEKSEDDEDDTEDVEEETEEDLEKGVSFEPILKKNQKIDFEKALRDTSHLQLKTITDKNGKQTRKWTDPSKGKDHHDVKPGVAVKYEHKGKEHTGTMKFVAKNGQYVIDGEKKHGVIGKHPHQIKRTTSTMKKAVEVKSIEKIEKIAGTLKVGKIGNDKLEKGIASIQEHTVGGFKNIGIVLKGIYEMQKEQNERMTELQDDLKKSLDENADLKEMLEKGLDSIEELGNSAPPRKSLSTVRDKKFIDKKELNKGLLEDDIEKGENDGKITLSISKHKNVILSKMDNLTFLEKGIDNDMANDMTLFESSGQMSKNAIAKLNKAGFNLVR